MISGQRVMTYHEDGAALAGLVLEDRHEALQAGVIERVIDLISESNRSMGLVARVDTRS